MNDGQKAPTVFKSRTPYCHPFRYNRSVTTKRKFCSGMPEMPSMTINKL